MTSHQSVKPSLWPSAISLPSAAFGGWIPKPRNESAASARIAAAMISVMLTTIGPTQFGSMCRKMIRGSLAPAAFAASTNSFSRSERKSPRTMRASPIQKRSARMMPDLERLVERERDRPEVDLSPGPRKTAAMSSTARPGQREE